MKRRTLAPIVALLAALATLTLGPVATGSAAPAAPTAHARSQADTQAARRVPPAKDFPRMPHYCATRKEEIPQKAVECHLNKFHRADPTIVLWGDSHAWMMIPALEAAVKGKHVNLVAFVGGSCPPMDPDQPTGTGSVCDQNNELAIAYVEKLAAAGVPFRALLGGSWQRYYHAIRTHDHSDYVGQQAFRMRTETPRLFRTLAGAKVATVVDGQMPTVPEHKPACRAGQLPYSCDLSRRTSQPERHQTGHFIKSMMRPLPGTPTLIGVTRSFCTAKVCHGLVDGIHTWFDDLHLSATRSATLAPYYAPMVEDLLAEADPTTSSAGDGSGDGGSGGGSGGGGGGGGTCVPVLTC